MKDIIGKSYYLPVSGELPVIFKILDCKKDKKLNDFLLTAERYTLENYAVVKIDEYNMWYNFTLEKEGFKEVTESTIKGLKKKYGVKKGLYKLLKQE